MEYSSILAKYKMPLIKIKHNEKWRFVLGNNPMVGATVAVAVAIQEAADAGKF